MNRLVPVWARPPALLAVDMFYLSVEVLSVVSRWAARLFVMTAVYLTFRRTLTVRNDVHYRVDVLKRQYPGKQDGSRSGQNLRFALYFVCF